MKRPGKPSFCFPLVAMFIALLFGSGCAGVMAPTNTGLAISFNSGSGNGNPSQFRQHRVVPTVDPPSNQVGPLPPTPVPVSEPGDDPGADTCKRFWEKIGPTDKLPPLIRDCLDITLYKGGNLKLILSLPWLKLVFP